MPRRRYQKCICALAEIRRIRWFVLGSFRKRKTASWFHFATAEMTNLELGSESPVGRSSAVAVGISTVDVRWIDPPPKDLVFGPNHPFSVRFLLL